LSTFQLKSFHSQLIVFIGEPPMHRVIVVLCALSAAAFIAVTMPREQSAGAQSPLPPLEHTTEACVSGDDADGLPILIGAETGSACHRPLESPAGGVLTQRRTPAFVVRQFHLPACLRRESRALASLRDCVRLPSADTVALGDATAEEKLKLVRARWVDGEWGNVIIGGTFVDLARALVELEHDTELGQTLLRTTARAVEMALEDAPKYAEYF
jgi:hypothetical protein